MTFKRNDGTVTKTVKYRYDMFDHLTRRILDPDGALGSAATTDDHYLWDGEEMVGAFRTSTPGQVLLFAYGPSPDRVLFEDNVWSALHTTLGDHLNTIRDVLNTSGTVENHIVYTTYGEVKSETSGGYSPFMHFTGKPLDAVTGLQYNVHRWYDAAVGRWTSEDPIEFAGADANLSRFVGNSPTNLSDPSGSLARFGGAIIFQPRCHCECQSSATDTRVFAAMAGYSALLDSAAFSFSASEEHNGDEERYLKQLLWVADWGIFQWWYGNGFINQRSTELERRVAERQQWLAQRNAYGGTGNFRRMQFAESGTSMQDAQGLAAFAIEFNAAALGGGFVRIRNAHLAGSTHPKSGIPFDKQGFPDFSSVAIKNVKIKQAGNYTTDPIAANLAAGLKETPRGYTWHHHQDGCTMQLVPSDIHSKTGHTGGVGLR